MNITEWFSTVWGWVVSIVGGLSFSAIITMVLYGCIKGGFAKAVARQSSAYKEQAREVSKIAVEEGLKGIKTRVHKHDIEPLVEARMKEVAKITSEEQVKALKDLHAENQKIVAILEKFAVYFDDSFYVSAEAKQELKDAIADAKDEKEPEIVESEVDGEFIETTPNTENNPQNESHKTNYIER